MEVTGRPNKLDMKAIKSKHTQTMLESISVRPQRSLSSILPQASSDAIDLLSRLLVFNPDRRLSVEDAIRHPYLSQFHNSADEPVLHAPISISIDDNHRYKIAEYRKVRLHAYSQPDLQRDRSFTHTGMRTTPITAAHWFGPTPRARPLSLSHFFLCSARLRPSLFFAQYLYRKIVERKKQLRARRAEQSMSASASSNRGNGGAGQQQQQQQQQQYSQQPQQQPPQYSQQQSQQSYQPRPAGSPSQAARPAASSSQQQLHQAAYASLPAQHHQGGAGYNMPPQASEAFYKQQAAQAAHAQSYQQQQQSPYSQQHHQHQQSYQQPQRGSSVGAHHSTSSSAYGGPPHASQQQLTYNVGGDLGARNQLNAMAAGQRRAMR